MKNLTTARSLAGVAIALAVLVACDQSPTASPAGGPGPAFGSVQGPAEPGQSPILRFALPGGAGWALLVDTDRGLAALASATDDIRSGDDNPLTPEVENLCPGEERTQSNPLPFQVASTRSGVQAVLGTGDLFTWVYDIRGTPLSQITTCSFLTGELIAQGLVDALQTNTSSARGANRLMASGTGRLDNLVDGGHVGANFKLLMVTNASGRLVRADVDVVLGPDPWF